jgi:hypothetical protein
LAYRLSVRAGMNSSPATGVVAEYSRVPLSSGLPGTMK